MTRTQVETEKPLCARRGWENQLTKQFGEYVVASELAQHERMLVATFAGNVPDFDLLAATEEGATTPVQVKTLCTGHWQFTIDKFAEWRMKGKKQVLGKKSVPKIPNLPCVFVLAPKSKSEKARFFILEWEQLCTF